MAWTKDQGKTFDLGYVNEQYFNVKVEYTQEEENKALQIMPCYVTQITSEELKKDKKKKLDDSSNTIYFRRFVVKKGMQKEFKH